MELSEIGLPVVPGSARIVGLAYCSPAKTLLATLDDPRHIQKRRHFIRRQDETVYVELRPPEPQLFFFENLAVASNAPLAFAMIMDRAAGCAHPYLISLPDGQLRALPQPTGYPTARRITISQLVSASPDGTWLHVVAAEVPPPRYRC